jgi:molecular chaperone GrpE (heat shock protein)
MDAKIARLRKRAADMRATAEAFMIESAKKKLLEAAESLERLADEREAWLLRQERHVDDQSHGGEP